MATATALQTTDGIELPVSGASYYQQYLDANECIDLLSQLDDVSWQAEGEMRTQHYGQHYNYRERTLGPAMELPGWCEALIGQLAVLNGGRGFDLCTVEEWTGRHLPRRLDDPELLGPTSALLNLGAPVSVVFELVGAIGGKHTHRTRLGTGDLLVLTDDARYRWTTKLVPGRGTNPARRLGLTFRCLATDPTSGS